MIVSALTLTHFRNFESLTVPFSPKLNVLYGDNGSGKTNLLEGIFVLCLGRSQRGAADSVLLQTGQEVYRLEGVVCHDGQEHTLAVAYQRAGRRRITIDQSPVRQSELYDRFCVVSAGPEDSEIISGPPSMRRLFLDIYLSQFSRRYLVDLTDYQRALAQKNAALKAEMDPSPFESILISTGARLIQARVQFTTELSQSAAESYRAIAQGEGLELRYEPSVPCGAESMDIPAIEQSFEIRLASLAERERAAHTSLVGPHRDDLAIEIKGMPARTFGSQGQWRTTAIALKLAVYDLLKRKRETTPILLLDEIFAELDRGRSQALVEAFAGYEQLFLTTAGEPPVGLAAESRKFRIASGAIEEIH
ncbi:MAG: DNA replication/repair protein RecF [Candidatus Zixiibacteriota bacterium]